MTKSFRPILATVVVLAASCGEELAGPLDQGEWGGVGVALTVQADGARIEFDCAHGRIDARLVLESGRFSESGQFVLEHGGPIVEGEEPDVRAAVYDGVVRRGRLELTIRVDGVDGIVGPYTLRKGEPGLLRKCL